MKIDTNKLDYKVRDFKQFLRVNWSDLVEHAEEMTDERYDGLEPLLSKEHIIGLAKELWEDNKNEISESIFDGATYVIPMADVSHIEKRVLKKSDADYECYKDKKVGYLIGITIITKHTTWNSEQDNYNNSIWIIDEEAKQFLKYWCIYRRELENIKN